MVDITGDGIPDLDITNAGDSVTVGDVIFTDAVRVGSGTGNYNTFLAFSNNSGVEQGFNTDDTPPIDASNSDIDHAKTHTVLLSSLVQVTVNGVAYYQFRIDLNEANSDPNAQISLDQFKIFTSTNGSIVDLTTLNSQNLIYNMDSVANGGNKSILLSDAGSTGSGTDDYSILIPVSDFAGLNPTTTYVYVFAQMGAAGTDWVAGATFEEWNIENGVTLSGTKFEDVNGNGVKDTGEGPIAGITIFIDSNQNGVLDAGERTTVTDANGNYSFFGVALNQTLWIDEDLTGTNYIQTTGDHETVTIPLNATPGSTITIDPIGNFIPSPEVSISKDASVPGDCADTVGEKVTYTVTLTNTGNVTLQNVVLKDAFEGGSNVTLTVTGDSNSNGIVDGSEVWLSGDSNSDGKLQTTETWTYTYVHTVTQADIDGNGGGNGTLDNVATATADGVQGGAADAVSDDASVDVCQYPTLDITKDASVPGDCADTVGELVTYTVTLDNTGNVALENVVLTDSFEGGSAVTLTVTGDSNSNGVVDAGEVWLSGDTGNDGIMGVNETWTYTYAHAVTQADIDSNGGDGDGTLDNLATANADAVTSGDTADTVSDDASVDVCQNPALSITKDASVPGDCADTVGERVTYTVVLDNIGNVALDNVVLKDAFEGGSNVTLTVTGDSNSNGIVDGSEVWLSGDTGGDGIMGVNETWTYTYVHTVTQSDIDSNGGDGDGTLDNVATANATATNSDEAADTVSDDASVDVCQNPALSITKDASVPGDCADTVGELVTYTVVLDNTGNVALDNVVLTDSFEGGSDVTLTVTGDSNSNGIVDAGEVWLSGDTGNDGIMGVNETWTYTYAHAVTQSDIDSNGGDNDGSLDNVATANATATNSDEAADTVSDDAAVDVCQNPALSITKDASVPGDCADTVGEYVTYTVVLDNTGNVALDNVVLTDSLEGGSPVTLTVTGDSNSNGVVDPGEVWLSGDTGGDGVMGVDETWTYMYAHAVTQDDIDSNGGDNDGTLDNVATANATAVNGGEAADEVSDDAAVDVCQNPGVDLEKYVNVNPTTVPPDAADANWDDADSALGPQDVNLGTDVWFKVTVENTGNTTLTGVDIEDVNTTTGLPGTTFDLMIGGALTADAINNHGATLDGDTDGDGNLDVGETWTIIYSQAFDPGNHINTATVTDDQSVTDSDDAHYFSLINLGPCPRTPGFWQNMKNGGLFWDNISGNEKHIGEHDFPSGELIYAVDSNNDGVINGSDSVGLLIGDYNHDGLTDNGEDTLFVSYSDARSLINANNKQMGDGKFMLGRDMVAVWLNYLAGVSIGDDSDIQSPQHYLNEAIDWMQINAGNTAGGNSETFDSFKLAGAIKPSAAIYNTVQAGFDHSASQMHTALDYFDNTGQTQPGGTIYANCDSAEFLQAVTLFESTHQELLV